MTAPALLLAKKWTPAVDPTGWWMSEKLDGVRAYWDGKKFLSRLGNEFKAPEFFRTHMPNVPLDGELWTGRKDFQRCVSIVRTQDGSKDAQWTSVTYRPFDLPAFRFPFEQRMEELARVLERRSPCMTPVDQERCEDVTHLYGKLKTVQDVGGEGLMLRQPGSMYIGKRSATLLKVKTFLDAEAVVVGHQPGEGKHKGRLGALVVAWPNAFGVRFGIGTGFSDAERINPPAVGSKVTFSYFELSDDGVPRFPTYVGPAIDK